MPGFRHWCQMYCFDALHWQRPSLLKCRQKYGSCRSKQPSPHSAHGTRGPYSGQAQWCRRWRCQTHLLLPRLAGRSCCGLRWWMLARPSLEPDLQNPCQISQMRVFVSFACRPGTFRHQNSIEIQAIACRTLCGLHGLGRTYPRHLSSSLWRSRAISAAKTQVMSCQTLPQGCQARQQCLTNTSAPCLWLATTGHNTSELQAPTSTYTPGRV